MSRDQRRLRHWPISDEYSNFAKAKLEQVSDDVTRKISPLDFTSPNVYVVHCANKDGPPQDLNTMIFATVYTNESVMKSHLAVNVRKIGILDRCGLHTDKETNESWDIFIIWKINSGLVWAAGPVLWKKVWCRLWATFEACLFKFSWAKNIFFENIVASALKSYIV